MREILIPFTSSVTSPTGEQFRVRIIGHERADGIWEGVIEFHCDAIRLVTGTETTQPNADALETWACQLSRPYYEAALCRARRPGTRRSAARQEERRV